MNPGGAPPPTNPRNRAWMARAIAESFALYADALDADPDAACGPLVDWFWNCWVAGAPMRREIEAEGRDREIDEATR